MTVTQRLSSDQWGDVLTLYGCMNQTCMLKSKNNQRLNKMLINACTSCGCSLNPGVPCESLLDRLTTFNLRDCFGSNQR